MWASSEQFEAVKRFVTQFVCYPQEAVIDGEALKHGVEFLVKEGIFTVSQFKLAFLIETNMICPAEFLPDE